MVIVFVQIEQDHVGRSLLQQIVSDAGGVRVGSLHPLYGPASSRAHVPPGFDRTAHYIMLCRAPLGPRVVPGSPFLNRMRSMWPGLTPMLVRPSENHETSRSTCLFEGVAAHPVDDYVDHAPPLHRQPILPRPSVNVSELKGATRWASPGE